MVRTEFVRITDKSMLSQNMAVIMLYLALTIASMLLARRDMYQSSVERDLIDRFLLLPEQEKFQRLLHLTDIFNTR